MKKYIIFLFTGLLTISTLSSCQPEEFGSGNGLSDPSTDATFTITPIEGSPNKFMLEAVTTGVINNGWNLGDGEFRGRATQEVFIPDAGTYTVTHTAYGRGGLSNSTSLELVVATSDPAAGNIIKGGKFETSEDHNEWTILNIGNSGTTWTFNPGNANVSGGNWNQQGIYQAIEIEANKEYSIDMFVSGSGSTDTWFEVYASPTAPVQGSDYTADGKRMGISTWDGCGNGVFSGKLSSVGCVGSGRIVSFPQAGTIYLVVKCGGGNIGTGGITIDNVEFRGVPQD